MYLPLKFWFFFFIILIIVFLAILGFKVVWQSQPDQDEAPAKIQATITNPNPLEPVTTCTSYGLKQEGFDVEATLKKICHTVYQ